MHALDAIPIGDVMAMLTVRNLPDEVHRALRMLAASHGRSTEAEVRNILELAVKPEKRLRMGDALAAIGRRAGLTDQDAAIFERDKTPAEPMRFE
jgi:plasmid stability protein